MMFKQKAVYSLLIQEHPIKINQSRCSRIRFNKSICSKCIKYCNADAIVMEQGLDIKKSKCSGCMLCVSGCSSDVFDINGFDFYSLVIRLKKIHSLGLTPVIGCKLVANLSAYEKTVCLGFLSEEHFIALSYFLKGQIQINLTACSECKNHFIVDILKDRLKQATLNIFPEMVEKIKIVEDKSALEYYDISYNRRGFFKEFKNFTMLKTSGLIKGFTDTKSNQTYSNKKIPAKRELLNRIFHLLNVEERSKLLENYYFDIIINENCNNCFACIGMCPTGALKIDKQESDTRLAFSPSFCNGCRLCKDFCMNKSVYIKQGFSGISPIEFINRGSLHKV